MSTNIFELAARGKIRFASKRFASLTVEDLFDLNLRELDDIAKGINRSINSEKEESFLSENKNPVQKDLQLRLEILKYVINVLETEQKARLEAASKAAKRQKLIDSLAQAEDRENAQKTPEQIRAELAALDQE